MLESRPQNHFDLKQELLGIGMLTNKVVFVEEKKPQLRKAKTLIVRN